MVADRVLVFKHFCRATFYIVQVVSIFMILSSANEYLTKIVDLLPDATSIRIDEVEYDFVVPYFVDV